MIYIDLFIGFLKVGLFSFGGAYGAIPLIRDEVLSYGWLEEDMLTYMIAVSESTPGPIMVNLATYVGRSQGGAAGGADCDERRCASVVRHHPACHDSAAETAQISGCPSCSARTEALRRRYRARHGSVPDRAELCGNFR